MICDKWLEMSYYLYENKNNYDRLKLESDASGNVVHLIPNLYPMYMDDYSENSKA